ncbi:Fructosamine/Ketosamine-3-kinase [Cristinia sonorae]|uniref:protein-ribulosamine 3-kinase n=1 Tax=Cristinia sonorae TaxID=1940300 RepID=A0A8K0XP90_9AGAR|nr:Fructosamine/Ketosamine-3-kinase [Cristinia sonorae]
MHSVSTTGAIHPAILEVFRTEVPDGAILDVKPPKIRLSTGKTYFFKIGSPGETEQYLGEAQALKEMHIAAPGLAPRLLACGLSGKDEHTSHPGGGEPYFVSDYKDMTSLTESAARKLGLRLATELHAYKSTQGFGFSVPTYCGVTRQDNGWYETWEECYDALIGGLVTRLESRGRFQDLCSKANSVRKRVIPKLLGPLIIQPVLLHGDLWSGNTGADKATGEPVIFDPSSYFGHNEADLAIARIFGGIPKTFFVTYHEHLPKTEPQDQYELRGDLYELYHYLNHTVIFGGFYASNAMTKVDRLLRAFPDE